MTNQIPSKYNPKQTEQKWYQYWTENNFFNSTPNEKPSYTIVIPPPNVTGVLHMGHMLNNTLQDVLIRKARMSGFNACWVPGTDHASIATEAKVVKRLSEKGVTKEEIGREKFLEEAWNWTEEYGGVILEQLKTLGASCDWNRTKFTLDEDLSKSVIKTFVELYHRGLIYRDVKMVNWDPEAKTTVSDEEVIHEEKQGKLFYLKYKVKDSDSEFITVATTRPETIFGDVAICVNPADERYQNLLGKTVIVPIVNREIPVIADEYVDLEFGTGCLKITPAHDINDYNIGLKHNLEIIDALNEDATLNHHALHYEGKDRFTARKEIIKELDALELLLKTEDYTNKVGKSERTKAVIEPRLSTQWFLKMEDIGKRALDVVANGDVNFYPKHFFNTYKHWLENIRDWNISRQLWWGHRIPAYYYGDGKDDFVIAETIETAITLAQEKTGNTNLNESDLKQDNDVLDTWFSSWLWPISVFNGINEPENEEINYYYPTADLVTAPDIIFFWVARMIMAGNEFRGKIPFKNVYFTGIVRDKEGRKMSKQLGNSPDPIELMEKYGADGVRVGLLLSSAAGNDLMFDEDLCLQGRNFTNKIWNAFRLIKSWQHDENESVKENQTQAIQWFSEKLKDTGNLIQKDYEQFRLSDVLMKLYKLTWDDFCSSYLELMKPEYGKGIHPEAYNQTIKLFEDLLKLLHPFTPFLTEEIWHLITERKTEDAITISEMPRFESEANQTVLKQFNESMEIVTELRKLRKEKQIPNKEELEVFTQNTSIPNQASIEKLTNSIVKVGNFDSENLYSFRVSANEYFVPLNDLIDTEAEKEKLGEELKYLQGFLKSVEKKLGNERFVANAPEKVVAMEKKKQSDALEKIAVIESALEKL